MSIQIRDVELSCSQCHKLYISLDDKYPCPNCKKVEASGCNFLNELVGSMKYYKAEYGQFRPHGFYMNGLAANIQNLVYHLFDRIEYENLEYVEGMFDKDIKDYFSGMPEYILVNVNDTINRTYERYIQENFFIVEKIKLTLWQKWKRWWRRLVP